MVITLWMYDDDDGGENILPGGAYLSVFGLLHLQRSP